MLGLWKTFYQSHLRVDTGPIFRQIINHPCLTGISTIFKIALFNSWIIEVRNIVFADARDQPEEYELQSQNQGEILKILGKTDKAEEYFEKSAARI